ncbi:DUF5666 domain-containing protein [Luteimonas sp. A482]
MDGIRRGIGMLLGAGVLFLAGCVSPGGHGGGDPGGYRQPDPGYPQGYGRQLQGTIDGLDRSYGRILLVVDDPRSGRTGRTEVRYDQRTRLFHQGREAAVEGLERGDVVRVDVAESGRDLWARSIEVLRDVRDGGHGDGYPGRHAEDARGPVAFVDPRSQVIGLDGGGYARDMQLRYDRRTTVEYRGRHYRPEDLDRGDLVRIQARRLGNGDWLAERIFVERSVRR